MTSFDIEVIVPPHALIDIPKLIKSLESALDEAAKGVQVDFNRTTIHWNHKPVFRIDKYPFERVIYTTDEVYRYVSGGTSVRRAVMSPDWISKTSPGTMETRRGRGHVVFISKRVDKPGIKAREYDVQIQKRWRVKFPEQIDRAIRTSFPAPG